MPLAWIFHLYRYHWQWMHSTLKMEWFYHIKGFVAWLWGMYRNNDVQFCLDGVYPSVVYVVSFLFHAIHWFLQSAYDFPRLFVVRLFDIFQTPSLKMLDYNLPYSLTLMITLLFWHWKHDCDRLKLLIFWWTSMPLQCALFLKFQIWEHWRKSGLISMQKSLCWSSKENQSNQLEVYIHLI